MGTDYADAKKRSDELLNPQLDAWRKREDISLISDHATHGTFDWMVAIYKVIAALSEAARQEPQVVRRGAAALKDGRNFGVLPLKSITPGAADRLFDRLKERPAGGERVRTAVLVVTICKRGMSRGEVIE